MFFQNPVFGASGCVGHGYEIEPYTELSRFGALSMKTVPYDARLGNKPPRVCEVDDGMMTSIGLQNPGVLAYIREELPEIKRACRPDQIIISIGGNEVSDYVETAEKIAESCSESEIAAIEVNGSCPNVTHRGGVMSASPKSMFEVVSAVKKAVPFPVIGKMNTNFQSFCDVAKVIEEAGAEAVYQFECSLIELHTQTVKRLLAWHMPEELFPVCTGAKPLWCEYILRGLHGELKEE